ncbi:MAG TPA: hypothetical protein HPP80_09875, partial [Rhodospirillaceae bacterium]|nr:hypothetical protein [Rhodospirillaceae bacterium]
MIREFLSFVTARASSHARRFGYVQESIAIDARYRRCAKAWASHLHSCHSAIGEAIRRCPGHDRAVVLGSGALYDIPLPHLAGSFREVVLLDIYHPPKARRQMRQWPNVRAIECDLLGLAEPALATVQAPLLSAWRQQIGAVDLVISSNLLTQLP